jgi:hypothetical protein
MWSKGLECIRLGRPHRSLYENELAVSRQQQRVTAIGVFDESRPEQLHGYCRLSWHWRLLAAQRPSGASA